MSKRVYLDTNVILDMLGEREPFYNSIAQIATLADQKKLQLIVSPISFATVNYFLSKFEGISTAKDKLRKFKVLCEISKIDETIMEKGLNSKTMLSFRDAVASRNTYHLVSRREQVLSC